jgi:4-diphosphocytidyl-2-C-methyl-D-erythritol kinase
VPSAAGLSTAAVFEEADRLGLGRSREELEDRRRALKAALEIGASVPAAGELLENDLQRAAISLCPDIARTLKEVLEAGADLALVSGSGPTVVGLFPHANGLGRAQRAAAGMQGRLPAPICATPVNASFAEVAAVGEPAREA